MKKYLAILGVLVVVVTTIALLTGLSYGVVGKGLAKSIFVGTFANSQVDTLKWVRESGVRSLAFGAYFADTVEVTDAIVQRIVNGVPVLQGANFVGDTLKNLTALDQTTAAAIAAGISTGDVITLSGLAYQSTTWSATALALVPLADEYWVIVTYASSGNGGVGSTDPVVRYEFIKGY